VSKLRPNRAFLAHKDSVIAVVPLNQHGCIVTISLDGATMDNDLYHHPFAQHHFPRVVVDAYLILIQLNSYFLASCLSSLRFSPHPALLTTFLTSPLFLLYSFLFSFCPISSLFFFLFFFSPLLSLQDITVYGASTSSVWARWLCPTCWRK
jgi:hypothetical protein